VSSAGGLYEGRRLVGPRTEPRPLRPYGRLKLAQEEALAASPAPLDARVYRLSSVYGHVAGGRRRGLIPTLLADGLRRRTSTVTGRPDTLRDFVWVEDVGRFVARELLRTGRGPVPAVTTLAAGRPASLHEVRRLIESALGRRLHVTYAPRDAGTADITFSPAALPPGWQPTDLRLGIRRVRDRLLGRGMSHWPVDPAG
jgi:nucleoside-diphosphate-sugar epimerase